MFPEGLAGAPSRWHLARDPALSARRARLDQDAIADQLLEPTFFNAEQTAHLVGGQHGDISTGHRGNTTPSQRRTEARTSNDLTKTPIESTR